MSSCVPRFGQASRAALALALLLSAPAMAVVPVAAPAEAGQPVPETAEMPTPAEENAAENAMDEQTEEGLIVVTGGAQRGSVRGDIAPELTLDAGDVRAFGASNLADLLQELGPQLRSGRGRSNGPPVVLVNGRRVSGFAEIRNLPPEALLRVEVLPEEVALKFGFSADQRVINFILRDRFRAVTSEIEPGFATDGGRPALEVEGNLLSIANGGRLSFEGEYEVQGALLESERRITTPAPSRPFDVQGNLGGLGAAATASGFGEISPGLSSLLGAPAGLVAVPAVAAARAPVLGDFAGAAPNVAAVTDLTPFRTLLPRTERLSLGATWNRNLGTVATTLTARFETSDSEARLGLPSVSLALPAANPFNPFGAAATLFRYADAGGALLRKSDQKSGSIGLVLNGDAGAWRWTVNANYRREQTDTLIDRGLDTAALQDRLDAGDAGFNPFAAGAIAGPLSRDIARATTDQMDAEIVLAGSPLRLPAGNVATTVRAAFETRRQGAFSDRGGIVQDVKLGRDQGRFQANIDLPLTSVRDNVLAAVGDVSVNFNLSLDELSDFGLVTTYGYGLNWSPTRKLRFLASVTQEEAAPTIQQLGNPLIVTPNVRVFDLVNGETVDITRLDGGNAALTADSRRVLKLSANWQPLETVPVNLSVNFIDSRLRGQVSGFPTATPEIEAAFPDRFVRGADGRLLQIDNRPINFAGADRQEIRSGLSLFMQLKPSKAEQAAADARRAAFAARRQAADARAAPGAPPAGGGDGPPAQGRPGGAPAGAAGAPAAGPPAGGRPGGGGGRPGGGPFGGGGGGRVFVSLFHTLHTVNRISIRDGVPDLDLLNGSAVGARGGQPRHEVEMRVGVNRSGFGGRLSMDWRAGTVVRTDPASPTLADGDLLFNDLATFNLRLFADLGAQPKLVKSMPFLRGSRISMNVDNIFNARLQVRNRLGEVPIGYQADQLDPLGRTIRIQFRKVFFARPPGGEGRGAAGGPADD